MLKGCIRDQLDAIVKGFNSLMNVADLSLDDFSTSELEAILCGEQTISVESLKCHTKIVGSLNNSLIESWFWDILEDFSQV